MFSSLVTFTNFDLFLKKTSFSIYRKKYYESIFNLINYYKRKEIGRYGPYGSCNNR